MSATAIHFAPGAKARALSGRLLTEEDYRGLMASKDLRDFVDYLRTHTEYGVLFEEPGKIIHRNQVELTLRKHLYDSYEKFFHYYKDAYRGLFKVLFMRYQVENIKLFIRSILRGESFQATEDHLIRSRVYMAMDYDKMAEAVTLAELVEALEGTPYHDLIQVYLEEDSKEQLFFMEMSLDGFYFKHLGQAIEKLQGRDRRLMRELLGKNVDFMNLQWVYRAKKYYGLSPELILNYTLKGGWRYNYPRLKALCYLEDLEEVAREILRSDYGRLLDEGELFIQRNLERGIYRLMGDLVKRGRGTLLVPVATLHFLEYEIHDINSILESIKYGITDPRGYLTREIEERG